MKLLLFLFVVLTVLVVVGHGIWVAIAWILRGGRSRHSSTHYEPTLEDDRAATARFLQHMRTTGAIDGLTHARIVRAIADCVPSAGSYATRMRDREANAGVETAVPDTAPTTPGVQRPPAPVAPVEPPIEQHRPATTSAESPAFQTRPEPTPPAPRRPFSEMLAGFMAEKNIRWGELVGGLLIVCCSAALVISLWSRIEAIPVLKFVIFTAMTAALFGAGLFVFHRWKIPTTGQVVLLVATFLVPLNLLAFAAFSMHGPVTDRWTIPIELAVVALFGWLTLLAARVVMPGAPRLFAGGVVGVSATSLVARLPALWVVAPPWALALLPVAPYVAVMAASPRRLARGRPLGEDDAKRLFLQLGVQTFACLVPFALIAYESRLAAGALRSLAPIVCALAAPAMFVGLFVWRRLAAGVTAQLRTAAASVALVATAVMLLAVGLAWPTPSRLIPAIIVIGLTMVAACRVTAHPAAHASAAAWFTAAWVLIVHVLGGLTWSTSAPGEVLNALLSARTGQALVGAVAACALLAAWFGRRGRRDLSRIHAVTAFAIVVISVVFVTVFGFGRAGDPAHVAWVYGAYAAAAFVVAARMDSPIGVWCGAILGQMAISQCMVYLWPVGEFAWPTALLVGASACAAAIVTLRVAGAPEALSRVYVDPLARVGVAISLLASVWMIALSSSDAWSGFSARMAWLAALWLLLATAMRWSPLLAGAQLAMAGAACAAVQTYLQGRPWYAATLSPLTEPWTLQAHALAVGGVCLAWAIARAAIHWRVAHASVAGGDRRSRLALAQALLNPGIPLADRWITILLVAALVVLSLWSVGAGVIAEHGWRLSPGAAGQHVHAAGAGSWLLFGVLLSVLLLNVTERVRFLRALGVLVVIACAAALVAARCDDRRQIVTAVRWLYASLFLASLFVLWTGERWGGWITARANMHREGSATTDLAVGVMCVLFALPVTVLTLTFTQAAGAGEAILPPRISEVGFRALLLGPCVLVAIGLMAYGHTTRRPAFAVATAVLASVVVTVVEFCALERAGVGVGYASVIWLVQLNALLWASVAIVWRIILGWERAPEECPRFPRQPLLAGRAAIGLILSAAAVDLWLRPGPVSGGVAAAGTAWGWFAAIFIEWALWSATVREEEHAASVWVTFGAVFVASALARFDTGNWLCFHAMMVGIVASGWLRLHLGARSVRQLLGSGWRETFEAASALAGGRTETIDQDVTCVTCGYNLRGLSSSGRCPECNATIASSVEAVVDRLSPKWAGRLLRARTHTAMAVLLGAVLATLFAMRAAFDDPQRPWWSVAVLAVSGSLCITLAAWAPRRAFAYAGCAAVCLAASVWWVTEIRQGATWSSIGDLGNLVNVNVIAVALSGLVWLGVERGILRGQLAGGVAGRWPALHRTAAFAASVAVILLAGVALCGAVTHQRLAGLTALHWFAWSAAVALLIACRLDPTFRHAAVGLYGLGLAAVVLVMAQAGLSSPTLAWAMSVGLAAYALVTMLASARRAVLDRDSPRQATHNTWLLVANAALATVALILGLYVSFTDPAMSARLVVVASPALCAGSAALAMIGRRRELMQTIVAGLLSVGAMMLVWAWIPLATSAFLVHRAIGAVAAVAVVTVASGALTAVDRGGRWATAVRRNFGGTCVLACIALLYSGGVEVHALVLRQAMDLAACATAALIGSLTLLIVSCVVFAVRDRVDPLRLPASKKGDYVYAGEWLAAALVLHVRATMPWLFSGVITQYWPLLVMALAFAAIAADEVCARRGLHVLARPLGRTGMFLPALGVVELFLASSQVHFSVVLLTAGALYAVLAFLRKSIALGLVAAMTLNASLWYLLSRSPGLGLTQHPQLWLIPPALAVLVAAYLNRARLTEQQRAAVHYVCLLVVYLSSTADIFLTGVARAPWLPLVLTGLSLVGILLGFISRVRSFLLLGTGFLCLSLLTMIWHAAEDLGWTWLWYVAGIALGVAIITVFALFEKKRNEINAWLDEIKSWAG